MQMLTQITPLAQYSFLLIWTQPTGEGWQTATITTSINTHHFSSSFLSTLVSHISQRKRKGRVMLQKIYAAFQGSGDKCWALCLRYVTVSVCLVRTDSRASCERQQACSFSASYQRHRNWCGPIRRSIKPCGACRHRDRFVTPKQLITLTPGKIN